MVENIIILLACLTLSHSMDVDKGKICRYKLYLLDGYLIYTILFSFRNACGRSASFGKSDCIIPQSSLQSFFLRHVFENSSGKLVEIPFIPITNTKESYEIVREKSEEEKNTLGMRSNFIFDEISKNYLETIILEYLHTLGTPGIAYNFYIL